MRHYDLSPLYRSTVGFDRLFSMLDTLSGGEASTPGYPPYNIERTDENHYEITIAVAGFSEDDMWRFRRARLYVAGTIYGNLGFKAQYDFAGTDAADFADVYMSIDNFLCGELKVGQMREPFSLNELTSSNNITFLERGLPNELSPGRSVGFQLSDSTDNGLTWAAGIFGANSNSSSGDANVGTGGYAGTGRVTWSQVDEDNDDVLHFGASLSIRAGGGLDIGFGSEISGFGGPQAMVATDDETLYGLEAAWVGGPLSFQAEFISAMRDLAGGGDVDATGFYLLGSYFLTGESRNYKNGVFGAVTPESNWRGFGEDGTGAWELALRYSMLENDNVDETSGLTAGVNWYLNRNARIMLNYTMHSLDDSAGGGSIDNDAEALQARFQITF